MTVRTRKKIIDKMGEAARTNSGRMFVIPWKSGWAVKREGVFHIRKIFSSKKEAIAQAKAHSKYVGKLVVYESNGFFKEFNEA